MMIAYGCKYQHCKTEMKQITNQAKDNHQASTNYLQLHLEHYVNSLSFLKITLFYLNYHKFSIKSYVLDVY